MTLNIEAHGNPWHFTLAYCRRMHEFEGRDPFEERNYRGLHLGRRGIRNLFLSGEVAAERCWRAARRRWERRR